MPRPSSHGLLAVATVALLVAGLAAPAKADRPAGADDNTQGGFIGAKNWLNGVMFKQDNEVFKVNFNGVAKCDQAVDPKCVKGVALSTVITSVRDASKTKAFNWPVADAVLTPVSGGRRLNAQCNILDLVLGPLFVDLLGINVNLNQLILTITGQTGPGALLANLLCGLTGILDNTTLFNLLSNIFSQLGGILG